jgi:O-antigen ligase
MGCYSYSYRYGRENSTFYLIALTILACAVSYVSIYMTYNVLGERGHFGVAYYALYLLPLALASDKRWLRIISIIIISIIIISSVKRGGLLALAIGMFVYLYVSRMVSDKSLKASIILYLYLIVMAVFLYFLIQYLGDDIIERFMDSDDDTGSGRLDIWESLYRRLKTQDITLWIFGNGHLATTVYSWENLSAHNDFLEIVYNYGIFNLFIYVCFLFSASTYTIRAIRNKDQLAPCLAMFLTIFLILSMISIIVLSHTLTLSMITLGFLIGWNEYDKRQRVLEQ